MAKKITTEEGSNDDSRALAFQMLILTYLDKNDVENKSFQQAHQTEENLIFIKKTLEDLGFVENIEEVIMQEWGEIRSTNKNITPKEFTKTFISEFHNLKVESVAPDFIKKRNEKILEAYSYIIQTIERIQAWLEDEDLRTRVESYLRRKPGIQSTIYQCTTPFCIISLGCDPMGRYNLVYSVDHRFQNMISDRFASTLIRRIYEFPPGEMEPFVSIGSLFNGCIGVFHQIIEETKIEPYHKVIIKEEYLDE